VQEETNHVGEIENATIVSTSTTTAAIATTTESAATVYCTIITSIIVFKYK